ncbi:serpin family protein [Hyalangium gracile]|uniref:serpin family protein n=1 Tax=Hyalangium gracile TaxID=394092 RepID=UPI001CCAD6B0|nr:serpin family protein [Hyalangium gracile]
MESISRLREILGRDARHVHKDAASVELLVAAALEAPEPERGAAVELLHQVIGRRRLNPLRRALSARTLELLDSADPRARWAGAALIDAGQRPEAIARLRRGLADADSKVRDACVSALFSARLGPEVLREHLCSERPEEREAALELANAMGGDALRPELRRLLGDGSARVRYLAAELLGVDETPGAWEVTLDAARRAEAPRQRGNAIRCLREYGLRREAIPALLEALKSDADDSVRESAAEVLGELSPTHPEVADALFEALADASPRVGAQAAQGLGKRGARTEALVPRLLEALEDERLAEEVRGQVALALASLRERAVVPRLIRLLERPDDTFQQRGDMVTGLGDEPLLKHEAVTALGMLGPLAEEAVPVLLEMLPACGEGLQTVVAETLEKLGTARAELEEQLCAILSSSSPPRASKWRRQQLRGVLARLKPEKDAALRELVRGLAELEPRECAPEHRYLWRAVGERPELIERIEAFTREEDPVLRRAAVEALKVLGRPTAEALEQLANRMESAEEEERETAASELRTLGSRAAAVGKRLTVRWPRLGRESRVAVLSVLGVVSGGKLDEGARKALKAGLQAEEAPVREAAAWALCDFGEVDAELVRLAEAHREDPEPKVREAVESALRIHGAAREEEAPREATGATEQAVRAIHELGLELYAVLREGTGNRVFSPLSLFTLLAMVLRGARARTEAELGRALHWPMEPERLPAALSALAHQLHGPTRQETSPHIKEGDEGFTLVSANGFWPQEGYPLRAEYLAELAEGFGVKPTAVDFGRGLEAAVATINGWAREHTRGRIPTIVSAGQLTEATRYVMANAVYFRSRWEQPFYDSTKEEPFHLLDGQQVEAPMMSRQGRFGYASGAGWQLIELPYRDGEASMVVLLPEVGVFERIERLLSRAWLERLLRQVTPGEFVLKLPRFGFDQRVEVSALAERLGLGALFEPDVDLTGMTPRREPLAGGLLHDATLTVDEKGTEAAAVTQVFHVGGVPPSVVVNRPFLFLIRHLGTGALLFLGRVMDPRSPKEASSATV